MVIINPVTGHRDFFACNFFAPSLVPQYTNETLVEGCCTTNLKGYGINPTTCQMKGYAYPNYQIEIHNSSTVTLGLSSEDCDTIMVGLVGRPDSVVWKDPKQDLVDVGLLQEFSGYECRGGGVYARGSSGSGKATTISMVPTGTSDEAYTYATVTLASTTVTSDSHQIPGPYYPSSSETTRSGLVSSASTSTPANAVLTSTRLSTAASANAVSPSTQLSTGTGTTTAAATATRSGAGRSTRMNSLRVWSLLLLAAVVASL